MAITMSLTSGDVQDVTGLTRRQIHRLMEHRAIVKDPGSPGTYHLFTIPEVLAMAYAVQLTALGYGTAAMPIVRYLAGLTEKQLLAEFKKGNKYLLPDPDGPRLKKLPGFKGSLFDMEKLYNETLQSIKRVAEEQKRKPKKRGRRRGLASE